MSRRVVSATLPEFPWDTLADVTARARAHPDGIVDLSVGTPVDPVAPVIQQALAAGGAAPGYPATAGTADLRRAMIDALARRYGVTGLTEAAVLPVIGTKELIAWLPTLLGLRNPRFVARYWQAVAEHGVTLLAAVPTVIAMLMALDPPAAGAHAVRALLTGGSPLPPELAEAFERRCGIPVRNILGMTECAGIVSVEPFLAPRVPGSCGLRLPSGESGGKGVIFTPTGNTSPFVPNQSVLPPAALTLSV